MATKQTSKATTKKSGAAKRAATIDLTDKRIVTETYMERVSAHDLDAILELCTEDVTLTWEPVGTAEGKVPCRQQLEQLFTAFPDFKMEGQIVAIDGDRVVIEYVASGTFEGGPFAGLEPTGRRGSVRCLEVDEFRGDQLARIHTYWDGMEMARQMGVLPSEGTVADRLVRTSTNLATKARKAIARS